MKLIFVINKMGIEWYEIFPLIAVDLMLYICVAFAGHLLFLLSMQIKVVNIRADEIVDGNPKLTLGLVWTLILHYQVRPINLLVACYLNVVFIFSVLACSVLMQAC